MKPIRIKFDIRGIGARIPGALRARFSVILLGVFFISIAVWAFIFWHYGIGASRSRPDIEVKIVKVKEGDLRKILDDVSAREAAREIISGKSIPNPFIKPAEAQ